MEKGWFHPDRGYWQTVGLDPASHVIRYLPLPPEDQWPRLPKSEWPTPPLEEWPLDEDGKPYNPGPLDPGPQRPARVPVYMIETYPEGTIEVTLKPGFGYEWIDGEWVPPSSEQIRETMGTISPRQLRHGLLSIKVYEEDIDAIIAAIPDEDERRRADIDWRTADEYERTHPLVVSIGETIGQTPEQVDSLWGFFRTI